MHGVSAHRFFQLLARRFVTDSGARASSGLDVSGDSELANVVYELLPESSMSWSACFLAFPIAALALALGSSAWIAFPRLIGFDVEVEVPVGEMPSILSFSAVNPPGISRFLATWAAARSEEHTSELQSQ